MKEFVGALNSYHILNFLVPGVLFIFFLENFSNIDLIQENTFIGIFLYYFIGMVLSRFGSLLIEPIFRILKILKKYDYEDYIKASHVNNQLNVLLEMRNMYRGLLSMTLVLLISFVFLPRGILNFNGSKSTYALFFILIFVFAFAWQKQNDYISRRVGVLKENDYKLPEKKKND